MRLKKCTQAFWLLALLLLPALQGCVKDDLSDCPTTGKLDVSLTYTFHNKGADDLFPQEITKVDFFVFDQAGTYVTRVTDSEGPFVKGYSKELELPGGDYKVVVWANLTDELETKELERGQVCYEQALLALKTFKGADNDNYILKTPASFFYANGECKVSNGEMHADTLSLTKNTSTVNLNVRWRDQWGYYCIDPSHAEETRTYIRGKNSELYFMDNTPTRKEWFYYWPTYLTTDNVATESKSVSGVPQSRVVVDRPLPPGGETKVSSTFTVSRLMAYPYTQSEDKIVITKVREDGKEVIVYERNLVELINKTGQYGTQDALDREDNYDIDIDFRCTDPWHDTGDTWVSCGIYINGWVVVESFPEI